MWQWKHPMRQKLKEIPKIQNYTPHVWTLVTWCPMGSIVLDFWIFCFFLFVLFFFGFLRVFLIFSMEPSPKSRKICFFLAVFLYFPSFFWISLNLLTCILKKRAFYLDFEAMWCKIYCKLQCFLYFILGKQHPCEHPFCIYKYIYIYLTHTHTHIYIYTHIYNIYIYIYIYIIYIYKALLQVAACN